MSENVIKARDVVKFTPRMTVEQVAEGKSTVVLFIGDELHRLLLPTAGLVPATHSPE